MREMFEGPWSEEQRERMLRRLEHLMRPEIFKSRYEMFIDEAEEEVRQLDEILISCPDSRTLMVVEPGQNPKTWRVR